MSNRLTHLILTIVMAWAMAAAPDAAAQPVRATAVKRIAALEASAGGRIGVAALDTGTGLRLEHRATERFAMCSTFKLILAAAVLARVDAHKESLDRRVPIKTSDLLDYAPVTRRHLKEGSMTVGALCAAAVEESDNTAANLLLRELGGPEVLTRFARSLGDSVTRLDRNEPSLNDNEPGDPRDTTSPAAMLETMRRLLLGDALSQSARNRLESWLVACTTGKERLRAGLPPSWRVGDKTGTGANGAANDVAILWPPNRAPVLVVVYCSGSTKSYKDLYAVIADVGGIVSNEFAGGAR